MTPHSTGLTRNTVFLTHAAPEDNEFALWLSSKLATTGYRVWIDRRRLRGGDDFWDEIDHVLRNRTIKQIVVFTENVGKAGVKKELAIGDAMRGRLTDPKFIIPVRAGDIAFSDAPPEFLRDHIINGYPNWHDCLKELFETLDAAGIPKSESLDATALQKVVEAREEGRRFVVDRSEQALTNWFPISAPKRIRYYRFEGVQEQMNAWLASCHVPTVNLLRLIGTFAGPSEFAQASSFEQNTPIAYDVCFMDFVSGKNLGPYSDRSSATNDVASLFRQHFDRMAKARGLLPVEFANKQVGWFFPDALIPGNKLSFNAQNGRRIRRSMSGKFKELRWHVCLLAKPRIWPELVYRIHVNVILSTDGKTPISGEKTHKRRRRLTRSCWNDVWRDRLLAAMHFLAGGANAITMEAGNERFDVSVLPLLADVPVSYEATDPPQPSEEDEEGTVVTSAALDDHIDDLDDEDVPAIDGDAERSP